jgi:hypothetical protein
VSYFFLLAGDARVDQAIETLKSEEILWPSALLWIIKTKNEAGRPIVSIKPPAHDLISILFRHAVIAIGPRTEAWKHLLSVPDFQMFSEFHPELPDAAYEVLEGDIQLLGTENFDEQKFHRALVCWRAWRAWTGIEWFIRAIVTVVVERIQYGIDPFRIVEWFRRAAFFVLMLCDGDKKTVHELFQKAIELFEADSHDVYVEGEGIAEFCVTLIFGVDDVEAAFTELLEARERLVTGFSPTRGSIAGFAIGVVRAALHVPQLRHMLKPEMFGSLLVKTDWSLAIDYFILEDSRNSAP